MEKLKLVVPKLEELWFRQRMMSDPATMSYNANGGAGLEGYQRETGCIDFPEDRWAGWYARWIGNEPERFYAYIKRGSDGAWIGEVCFYSVPERDWWDAGIVIDARYRGNGYAVAALQLLLAHAFRDCGVARLHNHFETDRPAAFQIHRAVGFRETGVEDGIRHVMLTREEYLRGGKAV